MGPIEATVTRASQSRRSSSLNSSAKFRAVDELVNVTASIVARRQRLAQAGGAGSAAARVR